MEERAGKSYQNKTWLSNEASIQDPYRGYYPRMGFPEGACLNNNPDIWVNRLIRACFDFNNV